jgi:antitoxin component YwqK of YwqJK toxin-antitoxin module
MVKIGYKKCVSNTLKYKNERCIVGVFEIEDDAIIFPSFDNTFAKYKVNKCKLIRIEKVDGEIINDIDSVYPTIFFSKEPLHEYKINEEFEIDFVGQNINDVGILMFFERARAEMYLLENKENGFLVRWRDDGTKYCEENYINYIRNGLCKYFYNSGIIKEEADYKNNYKGGIEKLYDEKGVLIKTIDHTPPPIMYDNYKT